MTTLRATLRLALLAFAITAAPARAQTAGAAATPAGPPTEGAAAASPARGASAAATAEGAATASPAEASGTHSTAPPTSERLRVADPYLELHTGPGRGYPVFFVVPRDEWVAIELRHTDWYKVRTAGDKLGWVHRRQLERTLTEAGGAKTFRDVALDDYLKRRLELGAAWGQFDSEPMLKVWSSYRLSDAISLEGTLGQVQGVYSGSDFWHLNVQVEPWSDRRLSPFLGIGFGKFKNFPNASLVDADTTDAKLANAGLGLRWHFSERFVLRADYALYTAFVSDERSREFRAATVGLSFFF